MATCPTDIAAYQEEIKTIVFRGIDGITIPKIVRQEAYTLAVDIIIRSIARETYKNYECMPPESYYGAATLVMQDALELKIPVKFPRQRIYYGRVPEAFEQWNALVNFEYMRAYFLAVGESLQSLGTALGAGSVPAIFCCSLPEPSWIELPLREVYFHPPIGTQWEMEVSWIHPVPFSDSCDTFYEGFSRQVDGDKDDGLPPNGIFPNVAQNPNNPYSGLPATTPDSEQLGFSNSKSANLDDLDPENEIDDPYEGNAQEGNVYWLKVTGITNRPQWPGGCSGQKRREWYVEPLLNEFVRVEDVRPREVNTFDNGCGKQIHTWEMRLTGGTSYIQMNNNDDGAPTYEYKTGTTITDSGGEVYF
jgi:hypothetical protein